MATLASSMGRDSGFLLLVCPPCVQLLQLLLKASQDKKFLSGEAEKALAAVAKGFPAHDALALLEPFCFHSNGRVRAKATGAYELCASLMVSEGAALGYRTTLPQPSLCPQARNRLHIRGEGR